MSVEILEKRKYFDLLIAIFKIDLEEGKFGDLPFSCLITLKSIMEKKKNNAIYIIVRRITIRIMLDPNNLSYMT